MLIEKREGDGGNSVFLMGGGDGLWDFTMAPDVGSDSEWIYGSYNDERSARHAMRTGSPNAGAVKTYERVRGTIVADQNEFRVRSIRRKRIYGECGDEADIDRYLTGHTQPWGSSRRAAKNRTLTLGLMLWMSCGNMEEDFAENVASGVAMAEALQSAGYLIRIVGVCTAHKIQGDGEQGFTTPLVEFGQPIDEHALMAWGQPAACRMLGFSWVHKLYPTHWSSYGSGLKTTDAWLAMAGIDIFLAKQWSGNEQKQHIAKVLERIQGQE